MTICSVSSSKGCSKCTFYNFDKLRCYRPATPFYDCNHAKGGYNCEYFSPFEDMNETNEQNCYVCGKLLELDDFELTDLGYCNFCLTSSCEYSDHDDWLETRRTQLIIEFLCLLHGWQGWYINVPKLPKKSPLTRLLMVIK